MKETEDFESPCDLSALSGGTINRDFLAKKLARLEAIETSTIWRTTAPFRALGTWFKQLTYTGSRNLQDERGSIQHFASTFVAPEQTPEKKRTLPLGLRVVFISGEPKTPGHFYRVKHYAAAYRCLGAAVLEFSREKINNFEKEIFNADLVIIWRATWDDSIEKAIQMAVLGGARLVFDIDDLAFEPELASMEAIDAIRSLGYSTSEVKNYFNDIRRTLLACDLVTVSTNKLARQVARLNKCCIVLPNGFDERSFELARKCVRESNLNKNQGRKLRIGYAAGTRSHQRDFSQCASAVARLLRERPHCSLVLFYNELHPLLDIDEFTEFRDLQGQIEWMPYRTFYELSDALVSFDVNLAPLEIGNLYSECKSELKYFEAALVDVPTIASQSAPFNQVIRHGQTGLLAADEQQWYDGIVDLLDSQEKSQQLSRNAFIHVLSRYGPEHRMENVASLLETQFGNAHEMARSVERCCYRDAKAGFLLPDIPAGRQMFCFDNGNPIDASVVIPLYNYAQYVAEALDSVAAQTLKNIELIVVDDYSTDNSLKVARHWMLENASRFSRCMLIRNQENSGLARTRNAGFAHSNARFILPMDPDDILLSHCLEKLLAVVKSSNCAFAYPVMQKFGEASGLMGTETFDPARLELGNYIDAMALIRKSAWATVGGYDHIEYGWEDYDLWLKFIESGLFGKQVPEVLARFRIHSLSMSATLSDPLVNKRELIDILCKRHPWLKISSA